MNNGYDNDQNNSQNEKEEIRFTDWEIANTFNRKDAWTPHVDYGTYADSNSDHNQSFNGQNDKEPHYNEPPVLIDEIKEKKRFSRIGLGYALFTVISTVAALAIQIIVMSVDTAFYNSSLFLNLLSPVALYVFALPVLLIVISGVDAKRPEKKKLGFGKWLLFLLVGFGFMYIGAMIGNGVMASLSEMMGYDYSNALESLIDEDKLWLTAIFTVIVAPVGEELVFRKLIIDRTNKYGGTVCIILSALIFGLMHGNFYQFFYCFGIGLILGYMYHSTGRILPCILMHATINLFGSVVPTFLTPVLEALENLDATDIQGMTEFVMNNLGGVLAASVFSMFVYAAMALAVILPIVLRKKIKLGAAEVKLPRGRAFGIIVGGAGMIIMLIVYALEFALNLIPM